MKKERKAKTPLTAAQKNDQKSASPNRKDNGEKRRVSHILQDVGGPLDASSLPEQNPNPVMRFTREAEALYGNRASTALLTYLTGDAAPSSWRELIRSSFDSNSATEVEVEHVGKIFSALIVPVREAGCVNVYCRDVTERRQMQATIRESEERLRLATQAAHLCTWELNLKDQSYKLGDNFAEILGFSPAILPQSGQEVSDLLNVPEDMHAIRATVAQAMETRSEIPPLQYRVVNPETEDIIWLEVNAKLVYDADGQPDRMYGMVRNITGRKQWEEQLRTQEAELQAVINQTQFMLTRCTSDFRYRFVSRTYAEMIGRTPEELAGKPIPQVMGQDGWNTIAPYVERVLRGERVEYETEVPFEGAGSPALHVIYTPDYDEEGTVIGWFASITDITARKMAENERIELLQREQAQRASAEQAQLAAEQATAKAEQELAERRLAEAALGTWANMPLPTDARPVWLKYGMALLVTILAVLVRQLLDPVLGGYAQFTLVFAAVAFSIWYGGLGPALLSALVGYIGAVGLLTGWQDLLNPTVASVLSLGIFLFSATIVMSLGNAMQRAQRHAHQSAGVAVTRQEQLESRLLEQQRVEEALRASEQRYREIFETAGVSVWVEDFSAVKEAIEELRTQGVEDFHAYFESNPGFVRQAIDLIQLLDVNQETLDLFGANSKEELLSSLNTIFVPETEAVFTEELTALAEGRDVLRTETQLRTLQGELITVLFAIHFGPNAGNLNHVVVTLTDITSRRQMEQALRTSEEKYRLIVETANEGVWEIDADTRTVFANPHMARMLGYDVDEMMGRSSFEFVFPQDNADSEQRMERARNGIAGTTSEFRFRRKDGSSLWTLVSSSPKLDEKGKFLGSVAMISDITDRKKMEEELRLSEEKFALAFANNPAAIALTRLEDGLIRDVNTTWLKLMGYERDEVIGHSARSMSIWPHPEAVQHFVQELREHGSLHGWEQEFVKKSGEVFVAQLSAQILTIQDEIVILSTLIDITERKRMEQALQDSERKFSLIYNNLPFVAALARAEDTTLVDVNKEFENVFGFAKEQAIGKTSLELGVNPNIDDRENLKLELQERGSVHNVEIELITKLGPKRTFLANIDIVNLDGDNYILSTMQDITERRSMEKALARERALLKRMFDAMPVMVSIYDPAVNALQLNPTFERLIGIKTEEETFLSILETCYPDPEYRAQVTRQMRESAENEWVDVQMHTREGRILDTTWSTIRFSDGMNVGLGIDISERKRAEDEIRRLNAELQSQLDDMKALMEILPTGVWIGNSDCSVITGNPAAYEMLGFPAGINVSMTTPEPQTPPGMRMFVNGEEVNPEEAPMQYVARSGRPLYNVEHEIVFSNGLRSSVFASIVPVFDAFGNVRKVIGAYTDFSERKQMEERLRIENERFAKFIDSNIVGIVIGDVNGHVELANDYYLNLLGVTRQDFIDNRVDWMQFTPAEWLSADEKSIHELRQRGVSEPYEKEYVRADGTRVPVYIANALLPGPGDEIAAFVLDISERKRAERSLIQYARQQESLFRLAEGLQHSYTYEEIYNAALDAILEAVGCDRASILLFDDTGRMRFVAWRGLSDGYREATDGHSPWNQDDRDIQPIFFNDIESADLSDELKTVIKLEGIGSLAFIPLVPNGKLIGKFMVYFDAPHEFSVAELDLGLTIARQLAFDIARKRAEEQLRRSAELNAFRVALADALRPLSEPAQIQLEAMRLIGERLNVDRVLYAEVDEENGAFFIPDNYVKKGVQKVLGQMPLTAFDKTYESLRAGKELIVPDAVTSPELGKKDRASYAALGIRSAISIPLVRNGAWLFNLDVHQRTVRQWTQHEVALLRETAERTWDAVERARTQQALRSSESLYRTIARSIPGGGVYIVDQDFRYLVAEGSVTHVFGLPREMVEGRTVSEVFSGEQASRLMARLRRNLAGETLSYETQHNGRTYWTQQAPIQDSSGQIIIMTIDITERKHAEDALRNSEERMRLAIESNRMVAWEWDPVTDQVSTSANISDVYGMSEVDGAANGFALIWPQDLPAHMEKVNRITRQGGEYRSEFRITRPLDGKIVWMEEHASAVTDGNGHVTRLVGIVTDVTERKLAEEALKKAREDAEATASRITLLQEITSSLAMALTPGELSELILEQGTRAAGASAGILVEVINNGQDIKTLAALGYPDSAVRSESPLSTSTPLSDCIRTGLAVWISSNEEFAEQYPARAEFRRGLGIEATVALPLIVGERVLGGLAFSFVEKREFLLEERGFLLAVAQQCAQGLERVRAAEALRESEERFAGFMQHLPGLAWIKDMQGRYVFANDAAEKAFRVPRGKLYGRTDDEVFPPHIAQQFRRNDEQTITEIRGIQVVEELEHEDGLVHYSLVNKFPILGSDGSATLIGGMAIDITERKRAEERLALLAEVSDLTRSIEEPMELMGTVATIVGRHLGVKRCLFNEIDLENDLEIVHRDYHDEVESVEGTHKITDYSSVTTAEMMAGKTVVNYDSKLDARTAADYERTYVPSGERAYVAVPLMRDDRWVASLWVSDDSPRQWSDDDVSLLEAIAERTWTSTEKLRINAALRDSEERLRVTFNTTSVGFATLTPDTHFVEVNDAFCSIVGYSREELLQMNCDRLTHPAYEENTRQNVAELLAGEISSFVLEKIYIRKDAGQIWVQNSVSLVRDAEGEPLHLIAICQDITERKQSEEWQRKSAENLAAAAQANAKFRTFFDQGSYFAGVMALDGTLVEANRLCLEFCGFTREDVIGKKFWDCGWWSPSPELVEMVRQGTQIALEGTTFRQESQYYLADGSQRFVDLIIAPVKDENGQLLFLAPTGTDITERKNTEEELRRLNLQLEERVERRTLQLKTAGQLRRLEMVERRQAEDRFAKSFNASPAAMTITHFEDGIYKNVNPKFIEMLGYELEEVIGHTPLELKIYKDVEERARILNSIRENKGQFGYETQLQTKTDKVLDVSLSVVEIELEGEPHLLSTIIDITERNQILAALRSSEQQLRALFDVLPVGISYIRPNGQVIESNRTLEQILEVTRAELDSGVYKSRQYIRSDGTPMPPKEFASARALKEQRTIKNVETGIIKDGGQVIWTSVSATPISMPEPGAVVITVDVTDRKHMDDELRRSHRRYQILSQRLVEIQEEERRTISRELHDRVGQTLSALNLNLNFMDGQLTQDSRVLVGNRLKDAIQLTEETVATIRDVMADLRPPALDDYGLEAALNAFADAFSRRTGIRIALVKPNKTIPRLNPAIELTLLRITQEALTNVARHSHASHATVTLAKQDNMVYLTIEDNGEGIRSWQKANRPGSHGLKIMRERAEAFGGSLQIHSFTQKGTKIEVKIPILEADPPKVYARAD